MKNTPSTVTQYDTITKNVCGRLPSTSDTKVYELGYFSTEDSSVQSDQTENQ